MTDDNSLVFIIYILILIFSFMYQAYQWLQDHDRETAQKAEDAVRAQELDPSLPISSIYGNVLGAGVPGNGGTWVSRTYDMSGGSHNTIKKLVLRADKPGVLAVQWSMDGKTWDFKKTFPYEPSQETPFSLDDFDKTHKSGRYMQLQFTNTSPDPIQCLRVQALF